MEITTGTRTASTEAPPIFGGDFRSTNLDLVLALVVTFGLPPLAQWLLNITGGALASLVLYYGVCCVLLVRWRKGTLDYRWPARWPWALFLPSLLLPLIQAARSWGALPDYNASVVGIVLTAIIWGGLNAAMEQLSWQYVLDAWRNRWQRGPLRWVGLVVGILLILTLVTLIHVVFWLYVLPEAQPSQWSWVTVPLNTLLTLVYVLLYYQSRSMWPVFVLHFLTDLQLVLLARYSMLPYL